MKTMFELDTGERLKCRNCCEEVALWGGSEIGARCPGCEKIVMGQQLEDMIHDQALYFEATRYKDQVKRAGSAEGILMPELVRKRRDQLILGGWEHYPMYNKLSDPDRPFHF